MPFEDARDQLESLVASPSLAVDIARNSEINPRYGDGVALEVATSQAGGRGTRGPRFGARAAPDPTATPSTEPR